MTRPSTTVRTGKCRHRDVLHHGWHPDGYWYEASYLSRSQTDAAVCQSCGAWLPLGPARDTPATAIELRAAEIAASVSQWRIACKSQDEAEGWRAHQLDGDPVHNPEHQQLDLRGWVASRWAGYLARCMWEGE
jgi:hypothetical protein